MYPFGPKQDCCCKLYRDTFDRANVNEAGTYRYQETTSVQVPVNFAYPSGYGNTIANWSIASGQISTSASGRFLRHFANTTGVSGIYTPLNYAGGAAWEFDLTFTGSGQVWLGHWVVLDFDTQEIAIWGRNTRLEHYRFDWPLTSGTTYRIRVLITNGNITGGAIVGVYELWIDGVPVKKFTNMGADVNYGNQSEWGAYGFIGSGTLAIGDVKIDRLQGTPCGENCEAVGPCFFPWLSPLPAQLQVDIPGEVVTGCVNCFSFPAKHTDFIGSFLLDRVISGCTTFDFNFYPCACYSLTGSFGCYSQMLVRFGCGSPASLAGRDSIVIDYRNSPSDTHRLLWRIGNDDGPGRVRYVGDTLYLSVTSAASGNCRPTEIGFTPIP